MNQISFSRLGNIGRLANQLWQLSSTIGIAAANKAQAVFPKWAYEQYFDIELLHGGMAGSIRQEPHFHYEPVVGTDIDLIGYFQSEKYFAPGWELKFKPATITALRSKFDFRVVDKETIFIHIRRGDYVGNKNYWQAPITYYIDALLTHFPIWKDCNIVIASDDLAYARIHFECLHNVTFAELNEIETMALASMCDHFILSNSTYSWWCAWLGEKDHSKVVHPGYMFAGDLAKNDTKDFWPERWVRHEREDYKLDISDMTFTIPVFHDHKDRKQNLDLSVCMLQSAFKTHIIVGEQGGNKFRYMAQYCDYVLFDKLKRFHRTRMLNQMANQATTTLIANWDCDVIIPPMQIWLAVDALRQGTDMIFPYDGRFARLPREPWFSTLQASLDVGVVGDTELKGKRGRAVPESSVGGAVFFRKSSFISGGMENEHMISFGPEDCERNDRFTMLGFHVERTGGCLFHIDHYCGPDSSRRNPYFRANHAELEKIRKLDKAALRLYVNTWEWRPKDIKLTEVQDTLDQIIDWASQATGCVFNWTNLGPMGFEGDEFMEDSEQPGLIEDFIGSARTGIEDICKTFNYPLGWVMPKPLLEGPVFNVEISPAHILSSFRHQTQPLYMQNVDPVETTTTETTETTTVEKPVETETTTTVTEKPKED